MKKLTLLVGVVTIAAGCAGAAPSPAATAAASPTDATPRTTFIPPAGHDRALGMTVTLPASGWVYDDIALGFTQGNEVNNLPEATLLLWSFPAGTEFWVYGDPCHWQSTRPATPATTAKDIVAGLAAQASRAASNPLDVTVGGYAGKSVTLHVPDDADLAACDSGDFTSYGVTGDEPTRYHQGPGQIDEFWVVDVDGAFAVIDATYRPDTRAALIEQMRSMAQSVVFNSP